MQWNMVQTAIITHNSVTTTIQTTSLRSSDGVLSRWLHVSLLFVSVWFLADELLVFKIYILIVNHLYIKLSLIFYLSS